MDTYPTVLIVDDSPLILSSLETELMRQTDKMTIIKAHSYKEVEYALDHNDCVVAVVDVNLPDAPKGEAIDVIASVGIPVIVLTGSIDESNRDILVDKKIFEFVSKNDIDNIRYVAEQVKRLLNNHHTNILIVDDSATVRMQLQGLLRPMRLNLLTAKDPIEALDIIAKIKISLVLTDYEMPRMNGLDLTLKLRERYRKDQMMIIAISSNSDHNTITSFLKHGANDYIIKPFVAEELSARISEKLNLLDIIVENREKANRDFLTGAYNRRFFFETARPIFKKIKRRKSEFAIAMFDIDHFKRINDTYGHDIGDLAIKDVSDILHGSFRTSDLIARFGGEEFCILLEDITMRACERVMEKVRKKFEKNRLVIAKKTINYTTSIGISYGLGQNIDAMLKEADEGLYLAKENGRNMVVINGKIIKRDAQG